MGWRIGCKGLILLSDPTSNEKAHSEEIKKRSDLRNSQQRKSKKKNHQTICSAENGARVDGGTLLRGKQ